MIQIFESKNIEDLEEQVNDYLETNVPEGFEFDDIEYSTSIDVIQTKLIKNYSAMVVLAEVEETTE